MGKELELAIKISGKLDGSLNSALNNAQKQIDSISKGMNRAATAATLAIAAAGVKFVKDSVQEYEKYESALNSAAAVGGVETGTAAYEALDAAAREAGRTTVKTAAESANALEYMMLAGWSVEDSTKALMPVLKLSAATGADLATTSDLVTDSMANLGLGINDLNHYLDVSAAANNKSNQTATQLQEAYLGVGGVLKNLNSPIEESAAVLGVLANRGTKGSEAGTALNAILVNMQKTSGDASKAMAQLGVSMYDSNGDARSIIDVFQDISDKTSGMTEQQRNLMYQMIGGKAHLDSFAKIMQGFTTDTADGQKEVYSLMQTFQNCDGALDNLYDIKMDTLEGSVTRLNSAFNDMQISIGEKIAPNVREFVDTLTDKMPQIETVISDTIDGIAPKATNLLNYLVNNSDKVVSGAISFVKVFTAFKLGTGTIQGINSTATLVANLSKLSKATGATKVLQGIIGLFTGIGTAAGTFGGTITGAAASLTAFVAPAAAVAAGLVVLGVAAKKTYDYFYNKKYNYADGMNEQAEAISKAANNLVKYNDLAMEVAQQREIIQKPESSTEQIENARARLQEIADMLGQEYNLVINADTTSLENAVNMAQSLSRSDMISAASEFIGTAASGAEQYRKDNESLTGLYREQQKYQSKLIRNQDLLKEAQMYAASDSGDPSNHAAYLSNIQGLYNRAISQGMKFDALPEGITDGTDAQKFITSLESGITNVQGHLGSVGDEINRITTNMGEFDESTQKAGEYLTQALASDVKLGDVFGTDTDVQMLEELGTALVTAGKSTQELGTQFAAAKAGYADFTKAIADGKASEMTQSFIDYEKSIGETSEATVQGAALIANGFQNVEAATAAGGDAINNVIQTMQQLGNQQGLFEELDNNGIADKLTDMAHAMSLIPENKSIAINAEGNFEIIQEAENQIASLNSIGNVDVSVNANGDFSILNEVTGEIQTLHGLSAVDLTVNADGNIDVLDKAGEVISTIDSKSAQVSIDGQVYNLNEIENAVNASNELKDVTATQTVTGTFNGENFIATAVDYQEKMEDVNKAQTVTGKFNGQDEIATAISYQSQLQNKSVTYTVTYKQNGTPPGENATGTTYWRGGLTYVNDQNIPDPREVIEYGGQRWFYSGRDVLADVPRGARIYNAAQSAAMIDGSHKNGLERVPFDGYIAELHAGERVLTSDEASEYTGDGLKDSIDRLHDIFFNKDDSNSNGSGSETVQFVFSPQIAVSGDGDAASVRRGINMSYPNFKEFIERYERDKRRKSF